MRIVTQEQLEFEKCDRGITHQIGSLWQLPEGSVIDIFEALKLVRQAGYITGYSCAEKLSTKIYK